MKRPAIIRALGCLLLAGCGHAQPPQQTAAQKLMLPELSDDDCISAFDRYHDALNLAFKSRWERGPKPGKPRLIFGGDEFWSIPISPGAVGFAWEPAIVQIIDEDTALVSINKKRVLAVGWATSGLADGDSLFSEDGAICFGPISFTDESGIKRTVHAIRHFDIEFWRKERIRRGS